MAAVITDPRQPDNPIVACNDAFVRLTGYARDEVIGRNCRFLAGDTPDKLLVSEMQAAVQERRPVLAEITNYKKDGTPFLNAVMIAPVYDERGELDYFLGSQMEVARNTAPARQDAPARRMQALSPRQRQVLAGLVAGKRNKILAHELGISERTVKMHRAAMLAALDVSTNAEAIRIAVEAGLNEADAPLEPEGRL